MGMPRFSTGATGPLGAELSLSRGLGRDAIREKNERASQQNGSLSDGDLTSCVSTQCVCSPSKQQHLSIRMRENRECLTSERESTEYVCAPLSTVLDRGAWFHRASVRVCVVTLPLALACCPTKPAPKKENVEKERQKRSHFQHVEV